MRWEGQKRKRIRRTKQHNVTPSQLWECCAEKAMIYEVAQREIVLGCRAG